MPRTGQHADIKMSNNIQWHADTANKLYATGHIRGEPDFTFTMNDVKGSCFLNFNSFILAQSWRIASIPFSEKYRNPTMRCTAAARLADQFWAEVFLDLQSIAPEHRVINNIRKNCVDGIYASFSARVQRGEVLVYRPRRASALR